MVNAQGSGVAITAVVPGSVAEQAGLTIYDVIIGINGKPVNNGNDLRAEMIAVGVGGTARLKILRIDQLREVSVQLVDINKYQKPPVTAKPAQVSKQQAYRDSEKEMFAIQRTANAQWQICMDQPDMQQKYACSQKVGPSWKEAILASLARYCDRIGGEVAAGDPTCQAYKMAPDGVTPKIVIGLSPNLGSFGYYTYPDAKTAAPVDQETREATRAIMCKDKWIICDAAHNSPMAPPPPEQMPQLATATPYANLQEPVSCAVTRDSYDKIVQNVTTMTYADAVKLIGCEGRGRFFRDTYVGHPRLSETYWWQSYDKIRITVQFCNKRVTMVTWVDLNKLQYGDGGVGWHSDVNERRCNVD
jgi:hypothetical protein